MAARAGLLLLLVLAAGAAVHAHDGPPYPIVSDRVSGPYVVSIWTDPDSTDDGTPEGKFWVLLAPADKTRSLPGNTSVRVAVYPSDRPGRRQTARAAPVDGRESRQFAALVMDHEGRFGVEVTIDGPLGSAEVGATVEATYDLRPPPVMVAIYALPFVLMGLLWARVLLRRRRARASRAAMLALFACAASAEVAAQSDASPDRVIGLLTLPEIFGNGPCAEYVPADITLYTAPHGAPAGTIRVVTPWVHHAEGGCEGLEVRVQGPESNDLQPLPVEEYEYEAEASIVLERREGWFRVRLTTGSAWINASDRNEFYSLERLLKDGLTHLTTDWNRRLSSEPGGVERTMTAVADQEEPSVRVTRFATVAGNQWMFVEVLSHSGCERVEEPSVVDRGWIPAHAATGKPTAWFSSRGC
jgi:hypothetical protein